MDIHMPEMDGIEATPKIIALDAQTPIVAMTANIMSQDIDHYIRLGMKDYIGKPFTSQELWRCLLKHLKPVKFEDTVEKSSNVDKIQDRLKAEFVKSNQTKFEDIQEAIATGDIKLAHRLAHTLKSNAGMIGKASLQAAAADMEYALVNETCLVTEAQMALLKSELAMVLDELYPLLNKTASFDEENLLSAEQTTALLEKLETMLNNRNPEALNHLDSVRSIPGAETLARQIEEYEFKAALITLSELKRN